VTERKLGKASQKYGAENIKSMLDKMPGF